MHHTATIPLSESLYRNTMRRLLRRMWARQRWKSKVWLLCMAVILACILYMRLWGLLYFAMGAFYCLAGMFMAVYAFSRAQQAALVKRVGNLPRSYTVTDDGVCARLTAPPPDVAELNSGDYVADPARPNASGTILNNFSIAWSMIQQATRQAEGWLFEVPVLGGYFFLPSAVLTPEVDAFVRTKCVVVGKETIGR